MSVLVKEISGADYLYAQFRDRKGKNRSLYLGRAATEEAQRKSRAVYGAYQVALIEDRWKKWYARKEHKEWPVRTEWLEKARDGKVTDEDRKRTVTLAWCILDQFHKDICQHEDGKEPCVVKLARDQIHPWTL